MKELTWEILDEFVEWWNAAHPNFLERYTPADLEHWRNFTGC